MSRSPQPPNPADAAATRGGADDAEPVSDRSDAHQEPANGPSPAARDRPRLELALEPEPSDAEAELDADAAAEPMAAPRVPPSPTLRQRRQEKRKPTAALVYVQKLAKLYPVQRGWLRRPQLLHAVNGVSFYIRRNETFGLVGESGSGKSTLGRCLLRLTEPTVGRVIFDGRDVTALPPAELRLLRQRMQIVFQDPWSSLNPNMTVREIVAEGIEVFHLARRRHEVDDRVAVLLERVGLRADAMDGYPHEFSGGQRQRIAIARALAVEPDFIVLDEPLTALDLSVQAQIINLLDDLQQTLGLTLLFISHDLRAVQYLSHRLAVMYRGRLMEMGPTQAVLRKRYHPYTRALFDAMPPAPWLEGQLPTTEPPRAVAEPLPDEPAPDSIEAPLSEGPVRPSSAASGLLPGSGPSALDPPRGCPLFARCPLGEPGRCDTEEPDLIEPVRRSHHRVACWHPYLDD